MRRREFIAGFGGAAAWPLAARAQRPALPLIAFITGSAKNGPDEYGEEAAFREGLAEAGYVDGQNTTIEYYWLNGQYDGLPALMGDLVRRRVAVIATPSSLRAALAAKAATATIPNFCDR
jgi:putative ABC transport system substrate-binding protein